MFDNWLGRYDEGGLDALKDHKPSPGIAWNKVPEAHRAALIDLTLEKPDQSPGELAVSYTGDRQYFVSESTVYRLLKAQDLITSPAYILQ